MQRALLVLVLAAAAGAQEGEIVAVRGRAVTLRYDFSDPAQLADFEETAAPRLTDAAGGTAKAVDGALVLEGAVALRHRWEAAGLLRARATIRVEKGGDGGLGAGGVVVDLADWRFHADAGLLVAWIDGFDEKAKRPLFREIVRAPRESVEKHAAASGAVDVEALFDGASVKLRAGGVFREGPAAIDPPRRFLLWGSGGRVVVDDLELTIEVAEPPVPPRPLGEEPDTKLVKTIKDAPLSPGAAAAARELALRTPKEWERLAALVRGFKRNEAYASLPLVRALAAGGDEPERREVLAELYRRVRGPEQRLEIALQLAPAWPENEKLLLDQLASALDGRRELFRELVWRGLPDDAVRRCVGDPLLAPDALEVLKARGARPDTKHLSELALMLAKQGYSRRAGLAWLADFSASRNWDLVRELAKLLQGKDEAIREGAYLMLLSVSDKDIAPDRDLWLSWVSAKQGAYEPPLVSDPGPVAAAIIRGRKWLRAHVLENGGAAIYPAHPDWPGTRVGATALAVYALRAAGVPRDDEAIRLAMRKTLLIVPVVGEPALRDDLDGYTYALSLLAMALESVDREGLKTVKEAIRAQLAYGQLDNGQWTYHCRRPGYGGGAAATGDNSNTQFAILGLRSLRRCGIEIDPALFKKTKEFWLAATNAYGGWGYGPRGSFHHEMSMTAAGISTLAICAEALDGAEALKEMRNHDRVGLGQRRLGELLLNEGYKDQEIYTLYGIERACILTNVRFYSDFDWYREGADILVRSQKDSGAWGDNEARGVAQGQGYGEACDTAFALLFLKRSTTGLAGADGTGVVKIPEPRRPTVPR